MAEQHTRFVLISFSIVAAASLAGLALTIARTGEAHLSAIAITLAMLASFTWWALRSRTSRTAILASQALILFTVAGSAFGLLGWSLAGISYDSYMHLVAGFVATMLASQWLEGRMGPSWRPLLLAGAIVFALGVGVEAVELADELALGPDLLMPDCSASFCPYWQDTVKDFINDALGIAFFIVARKAGEETRGEKRERGMKKETGRKRNRKGR